jgi:hypothetical protein
MEAEAEEEEEEEEEENDDDDDDDDDFTQMNVDEIKHCKSIITVIIAFIGERSAYLSI